MREDGGDGLVGDRGDGFVVLDDDLGEQGTVEHAAFSGIAFGVEVVEVGQDREDLIEPGARLAVGGGQAVEPGGDRFETGADAVLLGLEQVEWDRVGVVGLDELESFGFELVALASEDGSLIVAGGFEVVENGVQDRADVFCLGGGEAVGAVVAFDAFLDAVGVDGGAGAAVLAASAGAGEVFVAVAVLVAGPFDHELGPAGAVQVAFEVVVVLLWAFPDGVLGVQDGLYAQPGLGVHQRLVGAVVGDAAERDGAVVVGVGEHFVQRGRGQRFGWLGRGGPGGQAAVFEFAGQGRQ
ncbi:MAG: hypothetical protein QM638_05930 [Nocardioides sp.]